MKRGLLTGSEIIHNIEAIDHCRVIGEIGYASHGTYHD